MSKKPIILSIFSLFLLISGCSNSNNTDIRNDETLNSAISLMRKGYKVSGVIEEKSRFYKDDTFTSLIDKEESSLFYDFSFIYENKERYVGLDRKIYYTDRLNERHMMVDENLYNDGGKVGIRYLGYENQIFEENAIDSSTGNYISYGANEFLNPFLMIDSSDFVSYGDNFYALNNQKISLILTSMFSMISKAFSSNIDRNLIEISPDNKITTMVAYTSEYKEKVANPDYTYSYVGKVFKINFNFSSQGEGEARNALTKYQNNEKCDGLRPIFDVMEDSKMNIKRVNHTWYDDDPEVPSYETINLYYDKEKIYYQVYDLVNEDEIDGVTASDFLLMRKKGSNSELLYPHVRSYDGTWSVSGAYSSLFGYTYYDYLPIFKDVSEDLFKYDEEGNFFYLDEFMAQYWLTDGCFLPSFAVSEAGFFDYLNRVEVYLDSQNRLEKVICGYYIDFGLNICHSTYEIFYKYGDDIKMPYNIDEEVK